VRDEHHAERHPHDRAGPRRIGAEEKVEDVHGILRPGVYTIRITPLVLALALVLGRGVAAVEMLGDITVEPTMVKGAPTAPVTIVEFSDYQ